MADKNKQYGDEAFIYRMGAENEALHSEQANDIANGYIFIDEIKILFGSRTILNSQMSIIMPESFELMPKKLADIKYPSINRPDEIYTNAAGDINFCLSHKNDAAADEDIPMIKDMMQPMVMRMYPASKVIDSEVINVSGINIGWFDFDTAAVDMDIYNQMFIFSLNGRMVLGSSNCPLLYMNEWKPVFIQMLNSIKNI